MRNNNRRKRDVVARDDVALGVALSGGGVRGLAHLGVLQVLEEMGVRLDAAVGTSMGGLVAGLYAAGVPLADLLDFAARMGLRDLASPDWAWRGLFSQEKLAERLVDLLGCEDVTFQDLDVRTAVVATDIETGEMVILDRGPLIPALLATTALPILFAPVRHQGRWLVDGGAVNNLPVDVARQVGADRVLGVDVATRFALSLQEGPSRASWPRGLRALANGGLEWKLPFRVAEASMGITARVINRTRLALCPPDLLLEVDLAEVGILATGCCPQIVEAGRRAAMARAPELIALQERPLPAGWQKRLSRIACRLRRAWTVLRGKELVLYPGRDGAAWLEADLRRE
jgi:NTE family protein